MDKILERAEVLVREGARDEFIAILVERAIPLTERFTGLVSFDALKGIEDADSVMFLARWESIEAHVASRSEPAHVEFRALLAPYSVGAKPTVHFEPVTARGGRP